MKTAHSGTILATALVVSLSIRYVVQAANEKAGVAHSSPAAHVMLLPNDLKWVAAPPSVPPGAQRVVLSGDPTKSGPFTIRYILPARYKIPPHWHPADEHLTVLSGTFYMGGGDRFDRAKGKPLPPGSFAILPVKARHFAWTEEPVVIQVHGMGPWDITYVNSADDPRNK